MKKNVKIFSCIALCSGIVMNAEVLPEHVDRIFLCDGTEICGYVEKENLGEDFVDLHVVYMTFNVPDTLVTVDEDEIQISQMPSPQRTLLLRSGFREKDYMDVWDIRTRHGRRYPHTSVPALSHRMDEGMKLVVRENGTTMRVTDYTERSERVPWSEIKTIQKPEGGMEDGVVERIKVVDAKGGVREYEGHTLSNNIGMFRRFRDKSGKIYNFDNSRILVIERKTFRRDISLLEAVTMLDVVYLEDGGEAPLVGVIETENKDEEWIDFLEIETGDRMRFTYDEIAALGYRPKDLPFSYTDSESVKKRRAR